MRLAINCVYCPPKSSTTTPPSSDFGFCLTLCIFGSPVIAVPASRRSAPRSIPPPGSAICPAQKSSLRCVSHRHDVLPRDRPAPVSLLLPRLPPPPPSLFPALGRSLALEFRLRLRVRVRLDPHLNMAILRSKDPPYVRASPRVLRRGAAPWGPT